MRSCCSQISMTLALTPAAVCQCFTLVSLCTSIADPNWIQVQNCSDSSSKLIYGVAFTLHAYQNLTDTGPLGGLYGWGMWLLYSLAVLCYSAVLFSSSSFLLDFLGAAVTHSKLVTSLHFLTAFICVTVVGVCVACMSVIEHNLQRGKTESGPALCMSAGESFYIEMLGLLFSFIACTLALKGHPEPIGPREYLSVDGEDSDTEPLIGGAEREE
ncbi:transmembrane protein 127 isoform X2 [Sinocyclocheilus anshuiensis]|uniref:Transmembrane protein 127-like n=2 Tax=Sinocyclocheilus anshuiensis TaxID=1608454 RepID=A0A671M681_9TELE|nr:PREDICTED: transmembrane protein 127-like isoform X1 [Sinocyclocheilus anshuiensis]XP_016339958.1 PREDICTED: transmembrane protein 127-like isoform X2 [Sinocyclocheilus anshuiensis]